MRVTVDLLTDGFMCAPGGLPLYGTNGTGNGAHSGTAPSTAPRDEVQRDARGFVRRGARGVIAVHGDDGELRARYRFLPAFEFRLGAPRRVGADDERRAPDALDVFPDVDRADPAQVSMSGRYRRRA